VLDHRSTVEVSQRFAGKARRLVTGGDESDDVGSL
jgi:hypothetical protein